LETALTKAAAVATTLETAGIAAADFDRLVRLHQRRIYRVLLALVRDPDVADTLTQECFLRAYEKRASFRGESSVETWLVRIAVNLARDHAKSRRAGFWRRLFRASQSESVAAAVETAADPVASPERALAARQDAAAVWAVVEGLSPKQRAVFALRFTEEMTLKEIADVMRLEVGTVKAHLHRAVGAVRRRFATEAQRHRERQKENARQATSE